MTPIPPEEAIANAERRQKESEEALALLTPEVRTLLEKSNFSGCSNSHGGLS